MNRTRKIFLAVALAIAVLAAIVIAIKPKVFRPVELAPVTMTGAVLKQSADPRKQIPLSGVEVTATSGTATAAVKSDPSGFFSVTLNPGVKKGQQVTLTFSHPNYKPLLITATRPGNQLYLARMQPLHAEPEVLSNHHTEAPARTVTIKNIRVRYLFKDTSTVGVGSVAKRFAALNTGNVPCRNQRPCSPDGRWKATEINLPLDADEGNQFSNVRVSCIAGPCAFTRIKSDTLAHPGRRMTVSVLNWSDTAEFLVEADVTRTMVANLVRQTYPFVVEETMNFALPPGSEGPSVEADLDNQDIVFPLGPALLLSWANCSVEVSPDFAQIYRCQAKPGYRLEQ